MFLNDPPYCSPAAITIEQEVNIGEYSLNNCFRIIFRGEYQELVYTKTVDSVKRARIYPTSG